MFFWILWGIDALVLGGFLFFFFWGIEDGSVSSFNMVLWLGILAGLALVLGGGMVLRRLGQGMLAMVVLVLVALPAVLSALGLALLLVSHPRWN